MAHAVDRRTLVIGGLGAAAVLATGAGGKAFAAPDSILRPPGGQNESRFLAACLRCEKCRSVCPQNCVEACTLEDGLMSYRTPKLNFKRGACDFCGKCIEVCPVKALEPFDPSGQALGVAVVDEQECLAFTKSGCVVCVEACPYGVIALDGNNCPVVEESLCNGCGICELRCPSASLRSYSGAQQRGINVESEGKR